MDLSKGSVMSPTGRCLQGEVGASVRLPTVRGAIDARTGMVCDLEALQRLVQDLVVEPFELRAHGGKHCTASCRSAHRSRRCPWGATS